MPAVPTPQAAVGPTLTAPPSGFVKFAKDSFAGTVGEWQGLWDSGTRLHAAGCSRSAPEPLPAGCTARRLPSV